MFVLSVCGNPVLFTADETAKGLGKPGQEELLLSRWFNHYLRVSGSERQVWSFGAELADCVAYCTVLNAIDSSACPPPDEYDAEANASNVATAVQKMGIKVGKVVLCCRGRLLGVNPLLFAHVFSFRKGLGTWYCPGAI